MDKTESKNARPYTFSSVHFLMVNNIFTQFYDFYLKVCRRNGTIRDEIGRTERRRQDERVEREVQDEQDEYDKQDERDDTGRHGKN